MKIRTLGRISLQKLAIYPVVAKINLQKKSILSGDDLKHHAGRMHPPKIYRHILSQKTSNKTFPLVGGPHLSRG
jgi:hypothetical protein